MSSVFDIFCIFLIYTFFKVKNDTIPNTKLKDKNERRNNINDSKHSKEHTERF